MNVHVTYYGGRGAFARSLISQDMLISHVPDHTKVLYLDGSSGKFVHGVVLALLRVERRSGR